MKEKLNFLHPDTLKEWSIDVFKAIRDGILIADNEGIIQYVNPGYLRIMRMTEEEVLGKPLSEVRPGALLPTVIKTGEPMAGAYRKVDDVEYIADMAPIMIDNEIIGGVSIARDITKVKKLTEQLQQAKSKIMNLEETVGGIFRARYTFKQLLGSSPNFLRVKDLAERAAVCNANILIMGESGTGKELLAQAVHNASQRKNRRFIAINCSAIPSTLLESELFGYVDGAFTGSKKGGKIGLFQHADGGTLFLDEIGEMALDLQSKLLRILQEQKLRRVGDLAEKEIDVRVIAATNQDIEKMVEKGRFRQDLYYRLNVFQLKIPPLRERTADTIHLAEYFIKQYNRNNESILSFSQEVKDVFLSYDWPGNVRELKNVIEFACNMVREGHEILISHLPDRIREQTSNNTKSPRNIESLDTYIKNHEKEVIMEMLKYYGDTVEGKKKACAALGISVSTLYRKLAD